MRRRVEGIHLQEALDHLRTSKSLAGINRAARIDRAIVRTVKASKDWLLANFDAGFREEIGELTYFVPWDTERNIPRVLVDVSGVSLDTIWIA